MRFIDPFDSFILQLRLLSKLKSIFIVPLIVSFVCESTLKMKKKTFSNIFGAYYSFKLIFVEGEKFLLGELILKIEQINT